MKRSCKRGLVSESGLRCDLAEWQCRLREEFFREIDAVANEPLVASNAKGGFEGAGKVANR